ncbi:MAG: A/G-specific adenine glycosylase [Anaerolineae bacterium]|nr:A/G-specific adenine glycosylase [Anaerolineae bacterium]
MKHPICLPDDVTERVGALAGPLLDWFARDARDLPWRHDRTPYRVWVAEVMLQQTQVDTVIPYYARFLDRFPSVEALASAPLHDVLKVWEGLGYYARARNLHAAASQVLTEHAGHLPASYADLLNLPGLGPYAAGAVASIAFGLPVVALDGNARRVLARLCAIEGDPRRSATQRALQALAEALLPPDAPGRFNEALIELGATVCLPRAPRCERCPWSAACRAHRLGQEEAFPQSSPRRAVPHYDVTAAVTCDDAGRILIAQRAYDDFLGGMWEFPGGKKEDGETLEDGLAREMKEELDIDVEVGALLTAVKHAYTHFRITLYAFRCRQVGGTLRCIECADARWVWPHELGEYPMSVANQKIVQVLQAGGQAGTL